MKRKGAIEDLLLTAAKQWFRNTSLSVKERTAGEDKFLTGIKKSIRGDQKGTYTAYTIENGRVSSLWISSVTHNVLDGDIIAVSPFIMKPDLIANGLARRLVSQAMRFHKKDKLQVRIGVPPDLLPENRTS